jgi:hypothetical protein
VDRDLLVAGLTATFGGLAALLGVVGVVLEPLVLVLAVPFGIVAYAMWYQASGRLARRVYRGVEARARANDGSDRRERRARSRRARQARQRVDGGRRSHERRQRRQRERPPGAREPTLGEREAYARLGLEPGADEATVRDAYRERVKDVHPDRGGDEEAFKRVAAAYERLTE